MRESELHTTIRMVHTVLYSVLVSVACLECLIVHFAHLTAVEYWAISSWMSATIRSVLKSCSTSLLALSVWLWTTWYLQQTFISLFISCFSYVMNKSLRWWPPSVVRTNHLFPVFLQLSIHLPMVAYSHWSAFVRDHVKSLLKSEINTINQSVPYLTCLLLLHFVFKVWRWDCESALLTPPSVPYLFLCPLLLYFIMVCYSLSHFSACCCVYIVLVLTYQSGLKWEAVHCGYGTVR